MGILNHHLDILFSEASKNNFIKDKHVLCLSQQSVHFTLDQVYKLAKQYNDLILSDLPKNFDTKNKIPSWVGTKNENNTNAQTIFKLLGAAKVSVCDISEYENPDFLIDLNNPINPNLANKFDVIFDCGTLEHIFDVPTALWNLVSMLKTNGVLYLAVPASNYIDHGFYSFSPGLFFDYFNANGFEVLSCYLFEGSPIFYKKIGKLYKYHGIGSEIPILSAAAIDVITILKKSRSLTKAIKPMQSVYKKKSSNKVSQESFLKKKINAYAFTSLALVQNFLPMWLEIMIVKLRNKRGKNNINFIKKI